MNPASPTCTCTTSAARLSAQPWWTTRDRADLDLLAHALDDAIAVHEQRCPVCREGGAWCAPLGDGFDAVLRWRDRRVALRLAGRLAALEDARRGRAVVLFDDAGEVAAYELRPPNKGAAA